MSETQPNITLSIASTQDKTQWNEYVVQHESSSAYHQYAWLEAVNNAYGHSIAGVIAKCSKTGRVKGVFPAILMKIPLIGKHICSLPYCDIGYGIADNEGVLDEMKRFLIKHLAQLSGTKLEIRGVEENISEKSDLQNKKVRMLLSLPGSSEALFSSFKSKLRSQIKKAQKNGLTFETGRSHDLISAFYLVYIQNMRDLGSPVHAEKWFNAIIKNYDKNCLISVVYHDGQPIGGGLIIKSGSMASIPWASALRDFNHMAPNMLLYWSLLEHCANNNVKFFDFGRSTVNEGTYRFKKQWGAKPQLLKWDSFDLEGKKLKPASQAQQHSRLRPFIEKVWCKLPLAVTVRLGRFVRPYISL